MDDSGLVVLLMILPTVGIFLFVFWFIKRSFVKTEQQWELLAKRLSAQLHMPESRWAWILGKYPTIEGNVGGFPFTCYMFVRGSGKHQQTYTAFAFETKAPSSKTLSLYKEGFFSKIGKAFGGQDIQIGDEDFDKSYIIKSNDELFAKRVYNPRTRQLLLRKMPRMTGQFVLENGILTYHEMIVINSDKNREKWQDTINVGVEFAKEIQGR